TSASRSRTTPRTPAGSAPCGARAITLPGMEAAAMKRNSLPGAESEPVMRRNSLTAQFIRLLVGAGLRCVLLFLVLQTALRFGVNFYAQNSDFRQRETARRIGEFQAFVQEEELSSTDVEQISAWVGQQDFTLMELYRDQVMVYSSFVPDRNDIGHEG